MVTSSEASVWSAGRADRSRMGPESWNEACPWLESLWRVAYTVYQGEGRGQGKERALVTLGSRVASGSVIDDLVLGERVKVDDERMTQLNIK